MTEQTTTTYQTPPDHLSEPISSDEFKTVFRNHPAGVSIITADDGTGPAGFTATSVISVSANPPILMFSVSNHVSAAPTIVNADTVVVHMLRAENLAVAKAFATGNIDRFADLDSWTRLSTGEPVLTAAATWMRGRIVNRISAGDSTVLAVEALSARIPDAAALPLIYHNRSWHTLEEAEEAVP